MLPLQLCCMSLCLFLLKLPEIYTPGIPALESLRSLIQQQSTCNIPHIAQGSVALIAFSGRIFPKSLAILHEMEKPVLSSGFRDLNTCFSHKSVLFCSLWMPWGEENAITERCFPLHLKLDCSTAKSQDWRERKQMVSDSLWCWNEPLLQKLLIYFTMNSYDINKHAGVIMVVQYWPLAVASKWINLTEVLGRVWLSLQRNKIPVSGTMAPRQDSPLSACWVLGVLFLLNLPPALNREQNSALILLSETQILFLEETEHY